MIGMASASTSAEPVGPIANGWRYLIPRTGTSTAPDPLHRMSAATFLGPQAYTYAAARPFMYVDPDGRNNSCSGLVGTPNPCCYLPEGCPAAPVPTPAPTPAPTAPPVEFPPPGTGGGGGIGPGGIIGTIGAVLGAAGAMLGITPANDDCEPPEDCPLRKQEPIPGLPGQPPIGYYCTFECTGSNPTYVYAPGPCPNSRIHPRPGNPGAPPRGNPIMP